jgi:tRNA (mo5U34)-methyltransferase
VAVGSDLADEVAGQLWYHTIELGPGVVTPGWFDLRPVVNVMPWPDVAGRRCLDVGTYDGFLAFELERRGAKEVVAVDIPDHNLWDWPVDVRAKGGENLARLAGPEKGRGFRIAAKALGSAATLLPISVYDLNPDELGVFDVVVCGSLLLHLRDPLRALEAIRSVCGGVFLSAEQIDLALSVRHPRQPLARLSGVGELCQWWVPNHAGHRQMVQAGGFRIEQATRPYSEQYGVAHPRPARNRTNLVNAALQRTFTGRIGVPHAALLARPIA